jgi:DNA mismatch repair protein MLH3
MFNDELDNTECNDLLSRLAKCSFPFQCAHGRPSMVPLVDLGEMVGWDKDVKSRQSDVWKAWIKGVEKKA